MEYFSQNNIRLLKVVAVTCLIVMLVDEVRSQTENTLAKTLDRLFANSTYDRRVRPHADEGIATNVTVHLKINSINDIDEVSMDFSTNMYMRISWFDTRLRHNLTSPILLNQISGHLTWLPDLFFPNNQRGGDCCSDNSNHYVRIFPNGELLMSISVSATFSCFMDIRLYPVDNQSCYIQIESYGHNTAELNLLWDEKESIIIPDNLYVTEFTITDKSATRCDTILKTGSFPCLRANFYFMRIAGVYLMNAYLPAVLVVIMSWIAFWLHVNAIAARISIGLLTVLTMTTQTTSIISDLPRVPYIKAIEIWMCGCLVFVFFAFLETALAFVMENVGKRAQDERRRVTVTTISKTSLIQSSSDLSIPKLIDNSNTHSRSPNGIARAERSDESTHKDVQERKESFFEKLNKCHYPKGKTVDRFSRVSFPFSFAVFNIIYWIFCYTR